MSGSVPSEAVSGPAPGRERHPSPAAAPAGAARLTGIVALAYFVAHLALLPPALEDIDSINFALALHDFDPVRHQPHPPGYPLYVAAGRVAHAAITTAAPSLEEPQVDAMALSVWSAAGGAAAIALIVPLMLLAGRLAGVSEVRAQIVPLALILSAAPLFWISGLRPLSDMPGLAVALGAQVALLRACMAGRPGRLDASLLPLAAGACAAGLAIGVRSQAAWLTGPLLVAAIVCHRRAGLARAVGAAAAGGAAGVALWAAPLVMAAGGLERYLAAVDTIAGEEFSNAQMLATHPTARTLAFALIDTFVRPWGSPSMAFVVLVPAVMGAGAILLRARSLAGWMLILFGPYLAFHLLFQDTPHTRYALPLLVPVVWALAWLLAAVGPRFAVASAGVLAAASLGVVLPVSLHYADDPLPAAAAVGAAVEGQRREGGVVAAHFDFQRLLTVWDVDPRDVLPGPLFGERRELVRYWTDGGRGPVWFVGVPARTDLHLVDPFSRRVLLRSEWRFPKDWFLGGIRPAEGEMTRIESPPGWVAGEGWHLTREELILSDRRGQPDATMFVARREGPAVAFVGGESVAGVESEVPITITVDGRPIAAARVTPAEPRFFRRIDLPAGSLAGTGPFATLEATWGGRGAPPRLHLTQFELQPPDRTFWVYSHGWHDRELDPATGREWRWTSGRSELRVHSAGRDIDLQITGDVPIADLDGPPTVTISAGAERLRTIRPEGTFTATLRVTSRTLDASGGVLAIATDRTFVPDARTGNGDRRELGLRVYSVRVNPVGP